MLDRRTRARGQGGLTLLEVLLAVSILAVIVVVVVGSLRVGLRAWEAGARHATVQQEIRAVVEMITEALSGAYPYHGRLGGGLERVVLFQGEPQEVRFVTTTPPLALDAPATPFHAVTLRRTDENHLGVVERLVPAEEPFAEGPQTFLSRSVSALRLEYLDDRGAWADRWDGKTAKALPAAVRVALTIRAHGRSEAIPAFVVPIMLGKRAE